MVLGLTYSCQTVDSYQVDQKLWIGTYRAKDLSIPYPFYLEANTSKYLLRNHLGLIVDSSATNPPLQTQVTLMMQDHVFEIMHQDHSRLHLYDLRDTTHFPIREGHTIWKYRAKFVPAIKTTKLDIAHVFNVLNQRSFSCTVKAENPNEHLFVKKYLEFDRDQMTTRLDYSYQNELLYSEYQIQTIKLYAIGDKVFFSCQESKNNVQPIFQILKADAKKLVLRYFWDDEENIDTLVLTTVPPSISKPYSNCFDGHVGEYYHNTDDVTYTYGNDFLIQDVGKHAPKNLGSDGYIIVHFNVNCKSQMGRPGLIMMDKKYQSQNFSVPLVKHILQKVMSLKEWPSSVSDQNHPLYPYKDVHSFLMFKIENGNITDLCP